MRTREALQRSIEDLEAANEELQAGNEELMAANEELQSSNEELHALNEELYSVNSEHELKIQELRDTSADLSNLLRATELAIIFLDLEARLRLFTPQATQLFPLRPDDVGRELRDLLPRENDPTLFDDIAHTLVGQDTPDKNLCLSDQRVLRRRVTPYRTDLGVTNGVVITYVDVTQQVALREHRLEEAHQATLSAISRSVPHLMWTCTGEGACDFLNAQWVTYTGVPEAPQLGYGWLEQVHPDDHPGLMDAWNESVRTGLPFRTRFRIRRHDGQWRWFDTQGVPQLNEQGQIVKWYGSNTDVHDITLLTETLQARDEFIQMVTDNVNGMVGYWDRQLRNRFANRHYLAWFGKTAAEVRGMRLPDVLGSAVYEANRRYIEAALRGEPQHFQRTITKPDGTVGHLFAEYMPHIVNGEVLGFVVTATDITPVEEARLLADQVFLVSPVAKLIVDDKNRLLRWNPAAQQLLGYPDEQLQGLPLGMLIPPAMRQHHEQLQQAYLANPVHRTMGQSQDTTFPLVRADGSQVDVDIELSSVRLEGRQAVIVCIREAVLSPFAQKRLEQAHQARGTFLAQMSHEIRTPLNAILGMAQLLERESPTPKQMDRLRRIEDASNLLLNIVNDVLDLAKMEAGRMQLSCSPFHVNELVTRSLTLIEESARIKKLALHTHIASDVPLRLVGDERRIEQILVNLLSNAVKFTQQGEITVRITRHTMGQASTMLRFEVEDSGIGIAETQQKDLFTPFRQLQEGHARRYGGTGLGLSICRQLARLMNGECGVRSAPGYGSTFWFTAVLDTDPTAHASQPVTTLDVPALQPPATTPASGFPGKVVLVVEDNLINRTVIQELLTCETQVTVLEAEDGYQALAMAPQHTVDLVLMDIQMPGIDGLETTRRLRQMPGYATVPIYALTANVLSDDVNACLAAGMNGHFGKPLMFNDLLDTLHRLWADAPDASQA